jgi:insertion element IS1 protein InsB
MTFIAVQCPHGPSEQIVKRGKTARGTQRYWCQHIMCTAGSFLLDYRNRGYVPEVKRTIIDMRLHTRGVRDTARVLRRSPDTVLSELKTREPVLESVNTALLSTRKRDEITVGLERAGEAEMAERWSCLGKQKEQRWLWHAIDHLTGAVLASVFGRRQDEVCLKLNGLLEPFGITQSSTAHGGAYTRHLEPEIHSPGKRSTQKIEPKQLTFRTRIKRLTRQTICFSTSVQMHDIVVGLFVNRDAFGRAV